MERTDAAGLADSAALLCSPAAGPVSHRHRRRTTDHRHGTAAGAAHGGGRSPCRRSGAADLAGPVCGPVPADWSVLPRQAGYEPGRDDANPASPAVLRQRYQFHAGRKPQELTRLEEKRHPSAGSHNGAAGKGVSARADIRHLHRHRLEGSRHRRNRPI